MMRKKMKIKTDKKKIKRQGIISALILISVLAINVIIDSKDDAWWMLLLKIFIYSFIVLAIVDNTIKTPKIILSDSILKVNNQEIEISDIDMDRSIFTERKIKLFHKSASWKNALKANVKLMDDTDIQELKKEIWKS